MLGQPRQIFVLTGAGISAESGPARGIPTCALNLDPSDNARAIDAARHGPASETVPAFLTELGL